MTPPYLADDCIYYILKHLQVYRSTLFNCTLVNRFWCRAAIPLLYANPFTRFNEKIILSFILCFNKEEILQLKNQMKLIGINNIDINDEYKPLFEYPKYLKYYDYTFINCSINGWFNSLSHLILYNQDQIKEEFSSTFHQSILNHSINVEHSRINLYQLVKSNPNFNIPTSNLTKLNLLKLDGLKDLNGMEFLTDISNHCLNLKELRMDPIHTCPPPPEIQEKFCIIIQKQNNLEKLKIFDFVLNDNLFSSLEFQTHSLVSIEFSYINFSNIFFKIFVNLCNLNFLSFVCCQDTNSLDRYEILKFASFKLKELEFFSNHWSVNIEPTIIKYLGSSLQRLIISEGSTTIPMFENILIYCLNLIELEMITGHEIRIDLLVFPYFKNLKISRFIIYNFGPHDNNEMFKSLVKNLSFNVKEITFRCTAYDIWLFEIFFENCHNYLEKISLKFSFESLKMILNYIEKSNSLKILNIGDEIPDDEELNLLDKIKLKGIKITSYPIN
ncbi:hypothetical protein RclHR1_00100006 [Rhizophagus clarus]|uniref:F-box domain-containing protein n=1 Tax=Rhizophagus clarus TaxID=94130 RepID=A0A2Z6Q4X8_9GLOM|nr:hypothetical protein RclHR1_00100006 [Rhizophagus clarus]GES75678.1 hypothetical protein GLOIN_2v1774869 [Rhizophagus clarus]